MVLIDHHIYGEERSQWRHTVVCSFLCVFAMQISQQLSAKICNESRFRSFMKIKLNRVVIEDIVFELWRDLQPL